MFVNNNTESNSCDLIVLETVTEEKAMLILETVTEMQKTVGIISTTFH